MQLREETSGNEKQVEEEAEAFVSQMKRLTMIKELFDTVGATLDCGDGRLRVDAHFEAIEDLLRRPKMPNRFKSILQYLIHKRRQNWGRPTAATAPLPCSPRT